MKAIYGEHFSEEDAKKYITTIHINIIQGMKALTEQVVVQKQLDHLEPAAKEAFDRFQAFTGKDLDHDIADAIRYFLFIALLDGCAYSAGLS
jgi:hypothetical protein